MPTKTTATLLLLICIVIAGCSKANDGPSNIAVCKSCGAWHAIPKKTNKDDQIGDFFSDPEMGAFVEEHFKCHKGEPSVNNPAIVFVDSIGGLDPQKQDAPSPKAKETN